MLNSPDQDSSIGSSKMVTNAELAKKVEEQEELLQNENRKLKGIVAELASKLEYMQSVVEKKEMKEGMEEEEDVPDSEEDRIAENERPFFKSLKALG